ncbi:crotonase/enoyl-CoA hydratase family protein [Parvibaculum sp.]|uniref:crotonase/enoyl-CoA hydratase family protein n=1 Tax=Parvibaculum sp. TaxID=2024848 RepID=UPI001B04E59A|nr:crotonase/enoyl-CoA hydratase family protein [Parvibaculum sp.]MBO6634785.1 crotonase/enoyl-CoA hydratase family protein [Parvibaculum sp.]MBO6679978.1 crotonase/enoyl-CoA hydratase family protein [Parvibaculum sp.]MBO6683540.1 crotonase/enoyl-CoA hydratase family protein [Parvibaculum sp.]MBO6904667.1 crotonase/enoyl-CoA hydratase family protein [Parvibaculum sp.]
MSGPLLTTIEDEIAVLTMDDGRANALGHAMIDALNKALDEAETTAKAVLIAGREKRFCAGFDLDVMGSGPENVRKLVTAGAELLLRLYEYRLPVVMACTGHALAAGGLLLLSADSRIGTEGDFRIGLPEVAIGMTMPVFGIELARDRLARNRFTEAVTQARIYNPTDAVTVGYLDAAVPAGSLLESAKARATELAALQQPAFASTKRKERQLTIRHIRDTLDADSGTFDGSKPR